MEESLTYQKMFAEGRAEGIAAGRLEGKRNMFLRMARKCLGDPEAQVLTIIETASIEGIEKWVDRLLDVNSWQELLND